MSNFHMSNFMICSLVAKLVKNLRATVETQVQSWVWKIPWRRQWLATPVFLPGEFHGQRSLVGYILSGTQSDTREQLNTSHFPY